MENNKIDQLEQNQQPQTHENDFGTLAIDLGSSNTVVVFQEENGQPPKLLDLPTPNICTFPNSFLFPIIATIFVVPMSKPIDILFSSIFYLFEHTT